MGFKTTTTRLMLAAGFALAAPLSLQAQETSNNPQPAVSDMVKYANAPHLAYIKTNSQADNEDINKGLLALSAALIERTSVEPKGVVGLDIENDTLLFFPFIYWPVEENAAALSPQAQKKLQDYLDNGGVILFDLQDQSVSLGESQGLKRILGGIAINPLVQSGEDHTVMKSHYLLSRLKGSSDGQSVWIEAPLGRGAANDVSSVIISQENWIGAWRGQTHSKESDAYDHALRAGVNMVLYALTGDYKNDPIHEPTVDYKRKQTRLSPK